MFVHPGREGIDARTELRTLSLDRSGKVATLGLDGGFCNADPRARSLHRSGQGASLGRMAGMKSQLWAWMVAV
jgi:hypothetical protein